MDFVIILNLPNVWTPGKSRSPAGTHLLCFWCDTLLFIFAHFSHRVPGEIKKIHLLVFMQTRCSPSVGWVMWVKQRQMPSTGHGAILYREGRNMCSEDLKIRRRDCPLTSSTWQGRSSESRAPHLVPRLHLSVNLLGFYALASPLRDYEGLRFLLEGITVNDYKRACYWHQEKGQETLAEPQLCAKRTLC